eukprot:7541731-Ditylum_brightwellii.AAC.1
MEMIEETEGSIDTVDNGFSQKVLDVVLKTETKIESFQEEKVENFDETSISILKNVIVSDRVTEEPMAKPNKAPKAEFT